MKRAPHWAVQLRFSVIYVGMSVVSLFTKNTYAKTCGPNYVAKTCACSKSALGGYNRPVTPIVFISTIHWSSWSSFSMDEKEAKKKHSRIIDKLKANELQGLKNRGKKG